MKNAKRKVKNFKLKSSNIFKFLVVIFSFSLLVLSFMPVFADEIGSQNFIYLFHLYYDNGQLFANRDFEFKYDVIPEAFIPETINTGFPYKGEIVNLNNQIAATFQFDPRRGDPNFLKGAISIKAPYVPDGQKAVFYNAQGESLLTIFVSESSFCNDDGVCNADIGEDQTTCPLDCKPLPVPVASPDVSAGGTGGMLKGVIYLIIGLGMIGGWYGWKWWQNKKATENINFPNNFPPIQ